MVVMFRRQRLMASKTRTREVASSADVASSASKSENDVENNAPQNLTKNKDCWIAQDCTRKGQPLPLTSGKIRTTIPKSCIVPIWQFLNKAVQKGCLARLDDLLARRVFRLSTTAWSGETHRHVVVKTHVEEDRALRDGANVLTYPVRIEVLGILV